MRRGAFGLRQYYGAAVRALAGWSPTLKYPMDRQQLDGDDGDSITDSKRSLGERYFLLSVPI